MDPEQIEKLKAMLADHAELGGLDPTALQGLLDAYAARATTYTIHPGVAETERAAADPAVLAAADVELGNYHIAMVQQGLKTEMEGGGSGVAEGGRRAAPYLLRQGRWEEASALLDRNAAAGPRARTAWPSPCRCCAASSRPPPAPRGS